MKIDQPPLSVAMPVHNALPFLDASIGSILNQSFSDFEFVILNDASTDGSGAVLRKWEKRDSRIRVIESADKLGLAGSSNLIVSTSRARIIARMDADDISHPDRLRRQLDIMERDSDVVVVGTLCDGIDAAGQRTRPADRWRIVRRSGTSLSHMGLRCFGVKPSTQLVDIGRSLNSAKTRTSFFE